MRLLVLIVSILTAACGSSSPAGPSSSGYDGQWSGTTSQGTAITFTVSGQRVTSISFTYDFSGCVGTKQLQNVSVLILANSQSPPPASGTGPGFIYVSTLGAPDKDFVEVVASFSSNVSATGFVAYANCQSSTSVVAMNSFTWTATKR
jgi:hypothetical protein